jgi:hypothetical protein
MSDTFDVVTDIIRFYWLIFFAISCRDFKTVKYLLVEFNDVCQNAINSHESAWFLSQRNEAHPLSFQTFNIIFRSYSSTQQRTPKECQDFTRTLYRHHIAR